MLCLELDPGGKKRENKANVCVMCEQMDFPLPFLHRALQAGTRLAPSPVSASSGVAVPLKPCVVLVNQTSLLSLSFFPIRVSQSFHCLALVKPFFGETWERDVQ